MFKRLFELELVSTIRVAGHQDNRLSERMYALSLLFAVLFPVIRPDNGKSA
ncbi:hypothetical protein MKY98_14280 [Paenibacillus sp. FSL M8-0228]|jgi:hypothetical protein|uniref:hypothetical protein n=1 Tax=Paenibacillus TaxID=44249 RepID=UPI000FAE38E1|nr:MULTISPECIES: hypothetical protein [Paenibacillus]MBO3286897.1 hypothetical protein [Paenibacillus polymyxa]MBP1307331.1 hypothetical protein [Paenibacillus sp. 1182]